MTSKDRMIRALKGEPTDCMPAAPWYDPQYMADLAGLHIAQCLYCDSKYAAQAAMAAHRRHRDDWLLASTYDLRERLEHNAVEMDGHQTFVRNMQTGRRWRMLADWTLVDEQTGEHWYHPTGPSRSYGSIPDYTEDDWIALGYLDTLKHLVESCGQDAFCMFYAGNVFGSAVYAYPSIEEGLMALRQEPKQFRQYLERACRGHCAKIRAGASVGADGVWISEFYAGADMISALDYQEFAFPYTKVLAEEAWRAGLRSIQFFSGNPLPILEKLAELPVDGFAFESTVKGVDIDIVEVRKRLGDRVVLRGNLDAVNVLHRGRTEDVERAIASQLQACTAEGGLIMGNGSPIPPGTPAENVDLLVKCAQASRATRKRISDCCGDQEA